MSEVLPLILLFLFGGFAVVTAALKSRARVTAPLGVILAVLEALSGIALMVAAFPGSGSLESASRMGIVTAVMVGISSTVHLINVRAKGRARDESEGRRLHLAIKYGVGTGKVYDDPRPDLDMQENGDAPRQTGEGDAPPSDSDERGVHRGGSGRAGA